MQRELAELEREEEEESEEPSEDEATKTRVQERLARIREEGAKARAAMLAQAREEQTDETSEKAKGRRPRLAPPGDFSGDRTKYMAWKRVTAQWRSTHDDISDKSAGQQLLQALSGSAQDMVVGRLDDDSLGSYDSIMGILEESYGKEQLLLAVSSEDKLAAEKRKGRELGEFLTQYESVRAQAVRQGHKPSAQTEGNALLRAAELTPEARADVLKTLVLQGQPIEYGTVKKVLRAIADSHELAEPEASGEGEGLTRKEKKVLAAYRKGGKDGKGKGKGDHSKGKGKYDRPGAPTQRPQNHAGSYGKGPEWKTGDWSCPSCSDHQFARNEVCRRCKTPKPAGPAGEAPAGKGKDQECWFFIKGKCTKGAGCRFKHGDGAKGDGKGSEGKGPGKAKKW